MIASGHSLICTEPGHFSYATQPPALPRPGEALLRIRRIGICGTDLHAFEGTQPYFDYPRVLGHELGAELMSDHIPGFSRGDAVTLIPYVHCGYCVACRQGKTNCCSTLRVAGVHEDGGMAEYLSVPQSLLVQGRGLSTDILALVEPFSIGWHGVQRAGVKPGEKVLVVGAGPIGLGILECIRLAGGEPMVLDVNSRRLHFCREILGVQHTIHGGEEDVLATLADYTAGEMPSVVIDATGNLNAINNSFRFLAHGGRYVLVGLQKGEIAFSHPEFHKREATLMSSRNATRADFEAVINAFAEGRIHPATFITHQVAFDQLASVFPSWLHPDAGVIKAMARL